MALSQPVEKTQEAPEMEVKDTRNAASFKFNAQAPEFVPRSHTQMPISGYFYPCFHFLGDTASPDWFYIGDQEIPPYLISNPNIPISNRSKNVLPDELQQKIIKQVVCPAHSLYFIGFALYHFMIYLIMDNQF